ncbi:MAG: non-homologous end-joining DNA ligase, partial [Acidobacteriaceae bacterium]
EGPDVSPQPKRAERAASTTTSTTAVKAKSKRNAVAKVDEAIIHVRLTHPDKVLDPASGLTKRQLADYYSAVASRMLPQIAGRPLSLVRCPEGSSKPCFFQKRVNHTLPPGVEGVDVPNKKTGKPDRYITLHTAEALVGLAQMGVLEVHPWGSTNDDLEHPDRVIFDLDPDEALPWKDLCSAAADVRRRLKKLGLESFLKTTGGKGLHVVMPIKQELGWPEVKEFAHRFVLQMESASPTLYVTKMAKAARTGKIYLDYLRNERGATAVAAYSPRARPGSNVSLPLAWSALKLAERPVFSASDFAGWKSRLRIDPWAAMPNLRQSLREAVIKFNRLP